MVKREGKSISVKKSSLPMVLKIREPPHTKKKEKKNETVCESAKKRGFRSLIRMRRRRKGSVVHAIFHEDRSHGAK